MVFFFTRRLLFVFYNFCNTSSSTYKLAYTQLHTSFSSLHSIQFLTRTLSYCKAVVYHSFQLQTQHRCEKSLWSRPHWIIADWLRDQVNHREKTDSDSHKWATVLSATSPFNSHLLYLFSASRLTKQDSRYLLADIHLLERGGSYPSSITSLKCQVASPVPALVSRPHGGACRDVTRIRPKPFPYTSVIIHYVCVFSRSKMIS